MVEAELNRLLIKQLQEAGLAINDLDEPLKSLLEKVSRSYSTFDAYQLHMADEVNHRTQQLIQSTSKAYSFLDSINRGFIMCDTSGEIVLTNNSLRKLLSSITDNEKEANDSLSLGYLASLFHPDLDIKSSIHDCLKDGTVYERDNVVLGRAILHLFIAPLTGGGGLVSKAEDVSGVVILIEDVTEQKLLDRSKDEFLSIAAHELRTPLTAIRGNASLIKKYYGDKIEDPQMAEMLDDIHASCIRLIEIVNDFLDVSAIEQNKIKMQPESFTVGTLISEVCREMDEMAKAKGLELKIVEPQTDTPQIYADRRRIKQVIINLIGNALKFTDHGFVTISWTHDDQSLYVDVADTGKGMDIENQKLLFRKFQQASDSLLTRDATQGTGLGLYISKNLIELAGGSISLKNSIPGQGSTFRFSLPLSR
ncbi:MAG TPA: PAS domain-containing sensor histidine kinase [Candidatus Saccharimonadales bacterium]|nr:PAS domain-containing sensor histidine kinase [Candidatus Saccharimonadales bacterium]